MEKSKAIPQGYMTVGEVAKKMGVTVRTLQSVSYTHLDVYKRQDVHREPCRLYQCGIPALPVTALSIVL